MRLALRSALFFLVVAGIVRSSHADTIDDFTFTSASHSIAFSLPATSSFEDHNLFDFFAESAPATIDGVSGYTIGADFYVVPNFGYIAILYGAPASIGSPLRFSGPTFFTVTSVPANNPYPYFPYDIVPTFTPGTYSLSAASSDPFYPAPTPYTLTITTEASPVPEPSPLILLATGTLALVGRRKLSRSRQEAST